MTKPEQCHLCGHSHPVMAHWMSRGETRALCHEDDHSCYTRHNRSEVLRLDKIDRARAEGEAYVDIIPATSEFQQALIAASKAVSWTQSQVKALKAELNGAPRKPLIHNGKKP